jgi:hypothetical protein
MSEQELRDCMFPQDRIIKDILFRGFDHLTALAKALKKIQDEAKDEDEAIEKSALLSMVFRALNDVLHPGYASAQRLFPEQDLTGFLKDLDNAHKDAVENKIFPICKCKSCDESTTRNTDQAQ